MLLLIGPTECYFVLLFYVDPARSVARTVPEIVAAEVKTPHFSIPYLSVTSIEHRIKRYYTVGQLQHKSSQDTDLSCNVLISIFCCTI